jgi:tartrate dehydrogenase/decarboxylase/D-malate dehydrogenase
MPPFRIAAIPGDGIGGEVLEAGLRVLGQVAELEVTTFPWGSDYYLEHGRMLAADALEQLQRFDAIYFGAVGSRAVPDHVTLWGLRLAICQGFDQWANVRPVRFYEGLERDPRLDWVVVRENSEGEYAGLGGRNLGARGPGHEVAVQTSLFTERGCERIIRFAFELAMSRPRRLLTSVTKSNAQQYAMVLWDEVFARVAADYPEVATESELVDAMAARFVLRPQTLDVVVASNLHGDILSDLGSALAGSLGLAASANLNPERRFPSMFEPVHGSAPDIAGQHKADPTAAILSGALLLEHLGLPEAAARISSAVEADIAGRGTTPRSTEEVGEAIASRVAEGVAVG